ncbi:hypothetical protein F2P79_016917 [Pimephales promelas]|nr:hypothetical protein F2P79_016917 [Pimephales promelas]
MWLWCPTALCWTVGAVEVLTVGLRSLSLTHALSPRSCRVFAELAKVRRRNKLAAFKSYNTHILSSSDLQLPLCEGGRVKALCLSAVIRGVNSLTVLWNLATPTGFRKRGIQVEESYFDYEDCFWGMTLPLIEKQAKVFYGVNKHLLRKPESRIQSMGGTVEHCCFGKGSERMKTD